MYVHVVGTTYRIIDGVRRVKAVLLAGYETIPAVVYEPQGSQLGECDIPLDALLSSRDFIPRKTRADETRWKRAVDGAKVWPLRFPPISVVPGKRGWRMADVEFDFGDRA